MSGFYDDGSQLEVSAAARCASTAPETLAVTAQDRMQLVTAVAPGHGVVRCSLGDKTAERALTVTDPVLTEVRIDVPYMVMPRGTELELVATGVLSDGNTLDVSSAVRWEVDDPTVVAVSSRGERSGVATALAEGVTSVHATLDGQSGMMTIAVEHAALAALEISAGDTKFSLGDAVQLSALARFTDGTAHEVTSSVYWISSNVGILAFSGVAPGLAVALSPGTVTVSASLAGEQISTVLTIE